MSSDRDDIALLRDLVARYSPSTQEREAVTFLVEAMDRRGLRAYVDEAGNAVGEAGSGKPHIALVGHIDTVPGIVPEREETGRLYGRGTVDAKGPLAAFASALFRFTEMDGVGSGRITVVGAVEEECPTSKGAYHLVDRMRPDYVFIGEPSGWDSVTIGYKGHVGFDYRLEQPNAHYAGDHRRAGDQAIGLYNALQARLASHHAESEFKSPRLELRRFNTHDRGLTEGVEAYFSVRMPPGYDIDDLISFVTERAAPAEIECDQRLAGVVAAKNTPLVRALLRGIRKEGGRPTFKKKTGTSDMCILGPAWNCPIAAYGPGDSNLDHTPEEHIVLDEYLRSVEVLTVALRHLTATERAGPVSGRNNKPRR